MLYPLAVSSSEPSSREQNPDTVLGIGDVDYTDTLRMIGQGVAHVQTFVLQFFLIFALRPIL